MDMTLQSPDVFNSYDASTPTTPLNTDNSDDDNRLAIWPVQTPATKVAGTPSPWTASSASSPWAASSAPSPSSASSSSREDLDQIQDQIYLNPVPINPRSVDVSGLEDAVFNGDHENSPGSTSVPDGKADTGFAQPNGATKSNLAFDLGAVATNTNTSFDLSALNGANVDLPDFTDLPELTNLPDFADLSDFTTGANQLPGLPPLGWAMPDGVPPVTGPLFPFDPVAASSTSSTGMWQPRDSTTISSQVGGYNNLGTGPSQGDLGYLNMVPSNPPIQLLASTHLNPHTMCPSFSATTAAAPLSSVSINFNFNITLPSWQPQAERLPAALSGTPYGHTLNPDARCPDYRP